MLSYLLWAHHWTFFQQINNIWFVDVQFNPFLYPSSYNDTMVPKANSSTMIRVNLETGMFERLPAPFPNKHLIHIPLNAYEHSIYKIEVIRTGYPNDVGSLTNRCGIFHNNTIDRCYMIENGAFTVSSGNNECKLTYV
jgi:hypothetical protein